MARKFPDGHAEIKKVVRKKKGDSNSKITKYRVNYIAANGELLAPTQDETTMANAHKNIGAMIRMANGQYMTVLNTSDPKNPVQYMVGPTGKML